MNELLGSGNIGEDREKINENFTECGNHIADESIHVTPAKTETWDETGADLTAHMQDKTNPHDVTAAQVGAAPVSHTHLEIDKEEIDRTLLVGFVDGSKVFSDDGTTITSTSSDGQTMVKTFTNGFLTMTNVLKNSAGSEIARLVKTFDASGKIIDTVVTYS